MIELTKANQKTFIVNSDLIVSIESAHDTIVTLATGEKFLVMESVDEVVRRVTEYRRNVGGARVLPFVVPDRNQLQPER